MSLYSILAGILAAIVVYFVGTLLIHGHATIIGVVALLIGLLVAVGGVVRRRPPV